MFNDECSGWQGYWFDRNGRIVAFYQRQFLSTIHRLGRQFLGCSAIYTRVSVSNHDLLHEAQRRFLAASPIPWSEFDRAVAIPNENLDGYDNEGRLR